jgi:hypothetical protein
MVGEQPQDLGRLGVGGQLVHRVGAKAQPVVVAEPVGLLQHPGDLVDRHHRVGAALGPAVAAHRGAAHHLDLELEFGDHPGRQYLPALVACQATLGQLRRPRPAAPDAVERPTPRQLHRQAGSRAAG